MNAVFRLWAIFVVAAKRLLSQKWLSLATLLGLVVAIALTLCIPFYADAVYYRIFRQELFDTVSIHRQNLDRPPFAFMFRYIGAWKEVVEWEDIQPVDQYLSNRVASVIGLHQDLLVRHVKTDTYKLFPKDKVTYGAEDDSHLGWVNLGFIDGIEDHITLLEGNFPAVAEPNFGSTVEVLVSEAFATEVGMQIGEEYTVYRDYTINDIKRSEQMPVKIAGVWKPKDESNIFWFYTPSAFDDVLIVPQETFTGRISPFYENEVYIALWYLVMDGSKINATDAGSLLARITKVQQQSSALLPNINLTISPKDALYSYQTKSALLTVSLYIFSIPVLALTLTFLNLVIGLAVGRKHNETAVLRSRGATVGQIIGIAAVEGLILAGLALAIGLPVGGMIAKLMGQTQSFLNFSADADLRVAVTQTTIRTGLIAVGLALVAQVIPTIGAARHTIISYKQERARSLQPPWWQRAWLDILLLIPAGYGAYMLREQGSIISVGEEGLAANNPFQNPLLILVPSLGIFALTLLFIRILPLLMSALAWLASHVGGVGMLLATRQLSRSSGLYTGPMILLVLTLSLSAFTASLAQTLDNHLYDRFNYQVGSDVSLADYGETDNSTSAFDISFGGGGGSSSSSSEESESSSPDDFRWMFLPVSDYLKAPDVETAARIGKYKATTKLSGGSQSGIFYGVDRIDFPKVAFWRTDFSPSYLGELMNTLAIAPNGVLVPQIFMRQHALKPGDIIEVNISLYGGDRAAVEMQVMGGFDYFPTWYEQEEGTLFVGNLDYIFEQAGGQYPYDVWLKTKPGTDSGTLLDDLQALKFRVSGLFVAPDKIAEEQQNPTRQGLFGLLSVGFGAAAILTVLGFLLYALFSFRQRFIELGVLRAIGLSTGQMTIFLFWELAFLITTGLVLGTGLGVWVSELFIPYLQIGNDIFALTPPYLVEIAWPAIIRIYILFGLLFVVALSALTVLLMRMRIFEAVKLGETV